MQTKDSKDWCEFKRMRNVVNNEIKTAKAFYYKSTFLEHKFNSRKTWQTINELTSRKSNKRSLRQIKLDGISLTNSSEISDAFNKYFSTIGP